MNYFQLLGIQENATVSEIKKAYRKRAKELHPDKNPHPDAPRQFIELDKAYNALLLFRKTGRGNVSRPVANANPASTVRRDAQYAAYYEREKKRQEREKRKINQAFRKELVKLTDQKWFWNLGAAFTGIIAGPAIVGMILYWFHEFFILSVALFLICFSPFYLTIPFNMLVNSIFHPKFSKLYKKYNVKFEGLDADYLNIFNGYNKR